MDQARAQKEAEARKYRLQVRLGLIVEKARSEGASRLLTQAKTLRFQVDAVEVDPDEVTTRAAQQALARLEPKVLRLQAEAGVEEYGLPLFPKWLKFSLWTSPLLVAFGGLAFVLERRRRKAAVSAESLAALDEEEDRQ